MHNLTPNQKDILRWLVHNVKEGNLPESDLLIAWSHEGPSVPDASVLIPERLTLDTLRALAKEDLVDVCITGQNTYSITLTQDAYDAVESDTQD